MSTCIFCKIVDGTIPAKIIYQDQYAIAFEDVKPQAPVHILVIPKRHFASIQEAGEQERELLGHLLLTCTRIAADKGLPDAGYRLVTNTGRDGGQSVFHLHWHLLGGRPMGWPPG